MTIKSVHKSLASINEKTFFYINVALIVTNEKNKNNPFPCQLYLLSLCLFWLMQTFILTMILTLFFFKLAHDTILNW